MQSSSSLSSSSNTHQLAAAVADSSSGAMEASGSPVPASNIPYLGSKISLISKAKIRYEGILYTIDPQESTVALAKVRSYGTENRMADHFVPPRNEVYEYIIFRATDIEDLQVSEPPRPTCLHETIRARQQMRSQPRQEEMDPAIVQHAPAATTPARIQNYATGRRRPSYNDEFEMRPPGVPPLAFINRPFRRRGPPTAPSNNGHPSPYGRGRFRPRRNTSAAPNNGLKFDGDFDFEKANEEYNRLADAMQNSKISNDEEVVECPTTTTQTTNIGHYDKSKSFFDTISCEALEREKGSESKIRKSWQEEKQQNAETFGTVYGRFFGGGGGLGYGQQRYGGGPRRGRGGFINHGPPHPPHRFRRFNNNIQNNNEMIMQEPRQFRNDFVWAGGNYFNPGFRRGGGQIYRRNSPAVYG